MIQSLRTHSSHSVVNLTSSIHCYSSICFTFSFNAHPFILPPSSLPTSLHTLSPIPTSFLHPPFLIPSTFIFFPSSLPHSSTPCFLIPTLIPSSCFPYSYPHPFILLPSPLLSSHHPPSLIPTSSFPHLYPHPFILHTC